MAAARGSASASRPKLHVHDPALMATLGDDVVATGGADGRPRLPGRARRTPSRSDVDETVDADRLRLRQLRRLREAEEEAKRASEDARARRLAQRQREGEHEERLLDAVFKGLAYDTGATGAANETLQRAQRDADKKRRALHGEWREAVYDVIAARIRAFVDARPQRAIERRLRQQLQAYLTAGNTKAALFLDELQDEDYHPLAPRQHCIRYPTGDLRDPIKRDLQKRKREAAALGGPAPAAEPDGKPTLPLSLWHKLESTPYGRCTDGHGGYVVPAQSLEQAELQRSHVDLDHYTFAVGPQVVDAELPKGKAPVPRVCTQDLFEVLQRVDEHKTVLQLISEGKATGDAWLSHAGRRVVPGPELRRGRKNLFDVVHHTCAEGLRQHPTFTGGDEWLERKGKRDVPGPEQRRGRKDLFETFQQSSNPWKDGRALDDRFLEAKGKQRVTPAHPESGMARILQNTAIAVKPAPTHAKRYWITALVPADGSMTTRREAADLACAC